MIFDTVACGLSANHINVVNTTCMIMPMYSSDNYVYHDDNDTFVRM